MGPDLDDSFLTSAVRYLPDGQFDAIDDDMAGLGVLPTS